MRKNCDIIYSVSMKKIIPKDSRYIPFVQQKSCCVPTCILMIMYRNNIPLISQELLGHNLGLTVKKENKKFFWNVRTGKRPPAGWGTQMYKKRYKLNVVFSKLKIPLKVTFHSVNLFNDKSFRKFLSDIIKKDKDVIACYDYGKLNDVKERAGHACLVDKVNVRKNEVRLIDPSPEEPKWRVVKIDKLKIAMEVHGGNRSGGFWEFTKVKQISVK